VHIIKWSVSKQYNDEIVSNKGVFSCVFKTTLLLLVRSLKFVYREKFFLGRVALPEN